MLSATPPTTAEDVVRNIREALPSLSAQAVDNERARRVGDESIELLERAGAFSVATPARFGGLESTVRAQIDVASAVAEADGGAAWVTALTNVGAWFAGLYPSEAQDEIFGTVPGARVCGIIAPSTTAIPVDGGYLVSGKGGYVSGCLSATWVGSGTILCDEDGNPLRTAMVMGRLSDCRIEDTWHVAGMRASGSNTVVWEDVFVPTHRVLDTSQAVEGLFNGRQPEGTLYRSAFIPTLVIVLVGPQLGLARAALEYVRDRAGKRSIAYTNFAHQSDSVAVQIQIARAATLIDNAHLSVYAAAGDIDAWAVAGYSPTPLERAKIRARAASAIENVTAAIGILMSAHGAGAFAEASPLQRIWRDSNTAARHAVILPEVSYETYGKALLGRDDHITEMV